METSRRDISRWFLAALFAVAGANHFRDPAVYLSMMPPWLPWPREMNLIAGAAELLGGLGILPASTRQAAGWGLILVLVAIFPANLHMALHGWAGHGLAGASIPPWILWARLPLQALLVMWVWYGCSLGRRRLPVAPVGGG